MEANAHQVPQPGPQEVPGLTTVKILPSRDEQAELVVVNALAKVMDEAVTIPGTNVKIGLDPILGLLPVVGDIGSSAISLYMLRAAQRLGVPLIVQLHMLMHILIDTVLGLVPIVGDYLDILYKANVKNAALIQHAVENRETGGRSSWLTFISVLLAFILIVGGGIVGTVFLVKWAWNAAA